MQKVTVIGLGGMGSALAQALLSANYQVTVWNRTASRADPLVEAGANQAETVSAAIAASPTIITCINTHTDTDAMLAGTVHGMKWNQPLRATTRRNAASSSVRPSEKHRQTRPSSS